MDLRVETWRELLPKIQRKKMFWFSMYCFGQDLGSCFHATKLSIIHDCHFTPLSPSPTFSTGFARSLIAGTGI